MLTVSRSKRVAGGGALVLGVIGGLLSACTTPSALERADRSSRSVILINGDGMSAAQREAGRLDQVGLDGDLDMNSLPVSGLQTTDSADPEHLITDSAAAASAWATGQKTYNGAISVDLAGQPLAVLGAEAKEAGLATGLVTTAQVTDATPAAFFSSTGDRALQDEIARQYLEETKPDVILGGGEDWWLPAGVPGAHPDSPGGPSAEGSRGSQGDLITRARDLGYEYVTNADELAAAGGNHLLGLFANEAMFVPRPEGQGDEYNPVVPLAEMAQKALDVLSRDEDGFFLVIEEEAVDEMGHSNNGTRMLQAMRSLEAAVRVARAYVAAHPDTLLVVAGDHESGGLTIEDVTPDDESGPGGTLLADGSADPRAVSGEDGPFPIAGSAKRFVMDWTTTTHTGVPTPVTAQGPGSDQLSGVYPNTHVHEVIRHVLLG